MREKAQLYWHCDCGNNEPAQPEYEHGDSEPCCLCEHGVARVVTLEEAAAWEQAKALGKETLVERIEISNLRQRVSDLKHALGEDAGWFDRAKSAEKRVKEVNDALCMALVAIDTLIEAKPMLAANICGTTTLGNVRAEIKAVLHGR